MHPRAWAILASISFLCPFPAGADSRHDHGILNATSGDILLDVDASEHVSGLRLLPGECFVFDGIFSRVRVRLENGRVLPVNFGELLRLNGWTPPSEGYWLVDRAGFRRVSQREYLRALQAMAPERP